MVWTWISAISPARLRWSKPWWRAKIRSRRPAAAAWLTPILAARIWWRWQGWSTCRLFILSFNLRSNRFRTCEGGRWGSPASAHLQILRCAIFCAKPVWIPTKTCPCCSSAVSQSSLPPSRHAASLPRRWRRRRCKRRSKRERESRSRPKPSG